MSSLEIEILVRREMPIKAGMNLTVHPTTVSETAWAGATDNYFVGESGVGPCLHKTPKEIIVV